MEIMAKYIDKVCWCCLTTDGDIKSLEESTLVQDYCNLAGIKGCYWDVLPRWLCCSCIRQLKKARMFQVRVMNAYTLLVSLQTRHCNSMSELQSIKKNIKIFESPPPVISQSVLEVWSTPDNSFISNFVLDEYDTTRIDGSDDSETNTPLIKLESVSPVPSSSNVYDSLVIPQTQNSLDIKEDLDATKKKKKKDRKKSKTMLKKSTVVKNRMVFETEQYRVIRLNSDQVLEERDKALISPRYLAAPHKCHFCAKGFNYEDVLISHMSKHEKKFSYFECKLCHQFLPSLVSLRGHTKSHLVKYECKKCGTVKASRQHLLEHHSLEHGVANQPPKQYTCNVCGKTMLKRTMFQKHVKLHFPSTPLPCEKCGKSFKTMETLRAHKLTHTEIKRFKCSDCPKEFRYKSLLYNHRVTHITTKEFYCVECDLRFKTQTNLKLHLSKSQKHVDPDSLKFQCNECDKRFISETPLQQHIDRIHMGIREYQCLSCDRKYATRDSLRAHRRREHPRPGVPRPIVVAKHICDICNKAFKAKAILVKHIRTHTGERPFQCVECLRSFSQKSTLGTHVKLVHKNKKIKLMKPSDKMYIDTHLNLNENMSQHQE